MKIATAAVAVFAAWATLAEAKTYKEMFGAEPPNPPATNSIVGTMDFKQGTIPLPGAGATLDVPQGYYFLDTKDAAKLLEEVWNNPRGSASETLGMLLPAKYAPDNPSLWGAVVSYKPDGFVSDEDAASTDFDALIKQVAGKHGRGQQAASNRRLRADQARRLGLATEL